jgi:soluble lytic murein transglycosylase
MRKSRSIFARRKSQFSFSRSHQSRRKNKVAIAAGVGLSAILLGATLLPTKYGVWLEKVVGWVPMHGYGSFLMSGNQSDNSAIVSLISLPPQKRASQLEAIASGSRSLDRSRARYLLASDLIASKQGEKALEWLKGLEFEYRLLDGQIALKRAQAYELTGNTKKAKAAWEGLLKHHSQDPVSVEALYVLGKTEPKYWEEAVEKFPSHPRSLEIARALLKDNPNQTKLMVLLAKYDFDSPGITSVLDKLVGLPAEQLKPEVWEAIALGYWGDQKYGQASTAYAKAPRTPYNAYRVARGLDLAEKKVKALRAYKEVVQDFPNANESANALLRIAKIGPAIEAVPYLDQVISQFPNRAGEAILLEAKILDSLKSSESAAEARQSLLTKYGNTDAAAEYRWKLAQSKARGGNYQEALQIAKPITTQNPDSELARRAAFWVGKWSNKLGRKQEAKAAFENVVAKYPQSYYAWRSAVMLGWDVGDFNSVRQRDPKVEWPAKRPSLPVGSAALQELYQMGQGKDAWTLWQAEFENRVKPTVAEQFTDGLLRLSMGDHLQGIAKISSLEDRENPEEQAQYKALTQQIAYWQALYPTLYIEAIENWSQQRQLNPLLVISVIRQESRFEPKIHSSAGAVGLMQVMPETSKWVAENIGVKKYSLENPNDNVKLGTWYLDEIHDRYKNNSMLAIASYNAGSGNLSKWLQGKKVSDPDEFVEAIPFEETQGYVKNVFGNYWNYLRLYNPKISQQVAKYSEGQPTALKN